jgi:hypothetical protein
LITLVITLFNGQSLPVFINIGSYVGALFLMIGSWRLFNSSNDAIEQAHMMQRTQNFNDALQNKEPTHKTIIPMFLSSGDLFSAGLFWLVILRTVRYKWGIVLE